MNMGASGMDIYRECMDYFSHRGFRRALQEIRRKYWSLGRFGGLVVLSHPTDAEVEVLSRFLREDFSHRHPLRFHVKKFERELQNTRFEGISLEDILEGVLKEKLVTRQEARQKLEEERKAFFSELMERVQDSRVWGWIREIQSSPLEYRSIFERMDEKEGLLDDLTLVCRGLLHLPQSPRISLPVFAARISSDPHFFDLDRDTGRYFLKALAFLKQRPLPQDAEGRAELLYEHGILIDEFSNFVLTNGLLAWNGGDLHPVWKAAWEARYPLTVSLNNLNGVDRMDSPTKSVLVVENPSVFAALIEKRKGIPCICVSGQPNIAVFVVLSALYESGCNIFYSGDFDPEGLLIADKLLKRFPRMELCAMDVSDYKKSCSNVLLDDKRLHKLKGIEHPRLKALAQAMMEEKRAGYQETILQDILQAIESWTNSL